MKRFAALFSAIEAWCGSLAGLRFLDLYAGSGAVAKAVLAQARGDAAPRIMLHDYHLYCAAAPIRRARPKAIISHFTHIPWPPSSIWQTIAPREPGPGRPSWTCCPPQPAASTLGPS